MSCSKIDKKEFMRQISERDNKGKDSSLKLSSINSSSKSKKIF